MTPWWLAATAVLVGLDVGVLLGIREERRSWLKVMEVVKAEFTTKVDES